MEVIHPGEQPFAISEGILAFCLYMAGAEFSDPRMPVVNRFDPENLSKAGFKGEKLWASAQRAWKQDTRGHVEYSFKLSQRTHDLIKIYREQRKELQDSDGKGCDLILKIMGKATSGSMLPDEAILRIACVNLVMRTEFFNMWKQSIPFLKVPDVGKPEKFDTTATVQTMSGVKTVQASGVKKPGYKLVPLNATPETLKKLGL